jgi:hypothetical protein
LQLAKNQLAIAVGALTDRQWHPVGWLDSRYALLVDAVGNPGLTGHHRSQPASQIPAQIDAMKLAMQIDMGTIQLTHQTLTQTLTHTRVCYWPPVEPTPHRLERLTNHTWRPQDTQHITTITTEISSWVKAIDDLFAPKAIYLPDPCPQCGYTHARRITDDGQTVTVRALAVTADHGAICQHCHCHWSPDQLVFLGRVLGYQTAGITA